MLAFRGMLEIGTFEHALWGSSLFTKLLLVFLLMYRRSYRILPFFSLYVLLNFLQSIGLYEVYRVWGFGSAVALPIAWGTQGLVTVTRFLAVAEVCQSILANYRGIWRLAGRLLVGVGALAALCAWLLSRGSWQFAILNLDRGLELVMASVIVLLFLFAKHYEVVADPAIRMLGMGFFLYSSFRVLDDSFLERWLHHYASLWNLLDVLTFLASLLLWMWALRLKQERAVLEPELLPESHYRELSPAINARLKALNEQLSHFWHTEGEKT